jgi:single-stranded-DNA-specific exonuclease
MKKWQILSTSQIVNRKSQTGDIVNILLENRGVKTKKERENFLNPPNPWDITASDVGIDPASLRKGLARIKKAIDSNESIVVYADYDADGITAGAIMWEAIHRLGGTIMPYIPHRVEEGYGLSIKGIDAVIDQYHPTLIITVDHGITAVEKIEYAKSKGIDVVVTDHHVKPKDLPKCPIIHTTDLCGAGISWFVASRLLRNYDELVALAAIGTIADMVPLAGANRAIVKYGLHIINADKHIGIDALIKDAGLTKGELGTYDISHMLAPRLNAMGRLTHAMDALRLLCTKQEDKAMLLARKLGLTNKERQQLTADTSIHARDIVKGRGKLKKLLFVYHESYNQGVIGLAAGKLVDEFYRPAIVLSRGEIVSKASARSIAGFNIIEAIRQCSDILVDAGGHPMAAGFTVETKYLGELQERLEQIAEKELTTEKLMRILKIDTELPLELVTEKIWKAIQDFEPFGFGNSEPVFVTRGVTVSDARLVGADGKHLKLKIRSNDSRNPRLSSQDSGNLFDAIAFGMGELYSKLRPDKPVDIAYSIDMNVWNGTRKIQLKIKDLKLETNSLQQ